MSVERFRELRAAQVAARTPAPAPIVAVGDVKGDAARDIAGVLRVLSEAQEGNRNGLLFWAALKVAGYVAGGYATEAELRPEIHRIARQIGLEEREIPGTIESGWKRGILEPLHPKRTGAAIGADWKAEARAAGADPETGELGDPTDAELIAANLPRIDWHDLWKQEDEGEEWIVEPLIPARRLVALYSPPKVGKSLLLLELAAAVASGRPLFGQDTQRRRVLYVDMENDPRADVRRRLRAMGYRPDQLDDLVYLSFPTLAALDSPRGAAELLMAVDVYSVELVVIDTVSRTVAGDENENDTWLAFYRHTGLGLKQRGVALIRLDHAGKDPTKGQRGGSAKAGDVDAVWRMVDAGQDAAGLERVALHCDMHRFPLGEPDLTLTRHENPLRHEPVAAARAAKFDGMVNAVVAQLEYLQAPRDISERAALKLLKDAGCAATIRQQRAARAAYVGPAQAALDGAP